MCVEIFGRIQTSRWWFEHREMHTQSEKTHRDDDPAGVIFLATATRTRRRVGTTSVVVTAAAIPSLENGRPRNRETERQPDS